MACVGVEFRPVGGEIRLDTQILSAEKNKVKFN
jgi:hypothetical protein